jgi:GT2 family glycosyltransferase
MSPSDLVTIIVLHHSKAAYSRACLASILQSSYAPLEVIAVDNGSQDETPSVLRDFQDSARSANIACQVLTNEANLGAIVGRNQAMECARGDYVAFLDNDVVVGDRNWIEKLRAQLDRDTSVGIVSAKLLFPWQPHNIEFAGCAVSPNGRVQYLGRGAPRDAPAFNAQKEIQCAISACIMFRRRLIDEIGTLDEVYSPVQYEDLDFCYRARQRGYKVLYVPSVEMYHYEHTTTDGSVDIKFRYVTIRNGLTFKRRWQHMFAQEGGPPDAEAKWQDLARRTIDECPPPPPR